MSIDDVDFLKENSIADSYTVLIDSKQRDLQKYPTPSEYAIFFEQPYKNVFAVDVLDAAIPVIEYSIEKYENILYLLVATPSEKNVIDQTQIILELSNMLPFSSLFESSIQNYIMICTEAQVSKYKIIPVDETLNTAYLEGSDFNIALRYTKLDNSINLYINQEPSDNYFFKYNGIPYCIENIISNTSIIEIIATGNFYMELNSSGLYDVVYYNFITVTNNVFITIYQASLYLFVLTNYRYSITSGNYDVTSLRSKLASDWTNLTTFISSLNSSIDVLQMGSSDQFQGKYTFSSTHIFVINGNKNLLDNVLGFDMYPQASDSKLYTPLQIGNNRQIFMAHFLNGTYQIIPPGIINLGGARYLILRCIELEDLLYGSYAYNATTPGIGVFKLEAGSAFGRSNLRWDYVTLNKKPIHPIGKLSRLTFRFELTNGTLYDFKTVNHQFILSIKYYQPSLKHRFTQSILNPNYNPNLIEYIVSHKDIGSKINKDNEDDLQHAIKVDDKPSFINEEHEMEIYKKEIEIFNWDKTE